MEVVTEPRHLTKSHKSSATSTFREPTASRPSTKLNSRRDRGPAASSGCQRPSARPAQCPQKWFCRSSEALRGLRATGAPRSARGLQDPVLGDQA